MTPPLRPSRPVRSTRALGLAKRTAVSNKTKDDPGSDGLPNTKANWQTKASAVTPDSRGQSAAGTRIQTVFLPHDSAGSPLAPDERAWLLKTVSTLNSKLNALGLADKLPPTWTLQLEKGFADQATYNPLMNKYTLRVSQKLLNLEDETVVAHEMGHLVVQLAARAQLSSHHHLNEALADVVSSLTTGRTYVGSPDYQASRGTPTADAAAALPYVTAQPPTAIDNSYSGSAPSRGAESNAAITATRSRITDALVDTARASRRQNGVSSSTMRRPAGWARYPARLTALTTSASSASPVTSIVAVPNETSALTTPLTDDTVFSTVFAQAAQSMPSTRNFCAVSLGGTDAGSSTTAVSSIGSSTGGLMPAPQGR